MVMARVGVGVREIERRSDTWWPGDGTMEKWFEVSGDDDEGGGFDQPVLVRKRKW